MKIKIKKLSEDAVIPQYFTDYSAGMDLVSIQDAILLPGNISLIATGISIAIPEGFEGQVRPRSGLSLKGITVVNAPGTIDADYRGEVKVMLTNLGKEKFEITKGMRIAQLIVSQFAKIEWESTTELPNSVRGEKGFGSTGFH